MIRLVKAAAVAAVAVQLQGCMTLLYLSAQPSGDTVREMKARCEQDAGRRWTGPVPQGLDLWIPGQVSMDPADPLALSTLQPYDQMWANDETFLRQGIARALFVNIAPDKTQRVGFGFGPLAGEPAGIYRFALADVADPACAPYNLYRREMRARYTPTDPHIDDDMRCLTYDYAGPFDAKPHAEMFLRFTDRPAAARGLYRDGEVLFVEGRERARFVRYEAGQPGADIQFRGHLGIKACMPVNSPGVLQIIGDDGSTT